MPNLSRMTVEEVVAYLEAKKLSPHYINNRTKFKHPKRLWRTVSLQRTHENKASLTFSNSLPGFADSWNLSAEGELPLNLDPEVVKEALDDFFEIVFVEPPPGSPSFEQCWGEVKEVVRKLAVRYKRPNYEMSFGDLVAIECAKVHEIWLRSGNLPAKDFRRLVISSVTHVFESLLTKHYCVERRSEAETVALTDELKEMLPAPKPMEVNREEWDDYLSTLSPTAAALLNAIINPTEALCRDIQLDWLRYLHVKEQFPSARIGIPRYRLDHLSLVVHVPVEEPFSPMMAIGFV
jgi:hypothetical protein